MSSIFETLRVYATKWQLKDERAFSQEEIEAVDTAVVVASTYGSSVQFNMKSGGMTFIPLDTDSTVGIGEVIDLSKATLLTLRKEGENDIFRVHI